MDFNAICTEYYKDGFYDNTTLKTFVVKGKITADQYQTITGVTYTS